MVAAAALSRATEGRRSSIARPMRKRVTLMTWDDAVAHLAGSRNELSKRASPAHRACDHPSSMCDVARSCHPLLTLT
jgi:hypothetical protein